MRTFLTAVGALILCVSPLVGQDVIELAPGDSIEARVPVMIRALADTVFIAGDTVVLSDTIFVTDTVTVTQLDTIFVTDTIDVELPPDTVEVPSPPDTVVVQECPDGWTCTPPVEPPPDTTTTPTPTPQDVMLAGYVEGDEGGLHIEWAAPPSDIDSIVVYGGRNAGGGGFSQTIRDPSVTLHREPLTYDVVTSMWTCAQFIRANVPGEPQCRSFTWAPMDPPLSWLGGPSYSIRSFRPDGTSPTHANQRAVGDSFAITLDLVRRDTATNELLSTWADSSETLPDSVVFRVNGERGLEQNYPYRFLGDDGWYVIPDVDTVSIEYWVHGCDLHAQGDDCDPLYGGAGWPLVGIDTTNTMNLSVTSGQPDSP